MSAPQHARGAPALDGDGAASGALRQVLFRDLNEEIRRIDDSFDAVRDTRNAFQETMRDAFCDAVEGALGRKVIGFLSQVHINPDLSIETFILEPDSTNEAAAEG